VGDEEGHPTAGPLSSEHGYLGRTERVVFVVVTFYQVHIIYQQHCMHLKL